MSNVDPLRAEHRALATAVPVKRRDAHIKDGILAQTFRAAMELWDGQKADGVSLRERIEGLTRTLMAAWPKGRVEDWKYLCHECDDYGVRYFDCPGDSSCGRHKRHLPHDYVRACHCGAGQRMTPPAPAAADDYAQAGRTKKKNASGFGRF
jgi:hypothetical protein